MTLSVPLAFLLLIITLLISGFSSAMESAFLSLNRISIKNLENSKFFFSKLVLYFIDHFNQFIISILSFNLISNITSTLIANYIFAWILESQFNISLLNSDGLSIVFLEISFVISFTLIILIFSEFIPKKISIINPKFFAQAGSIPVLVIYLVTYPFAISILKVSLIINKFFTNTNESQSGGGGKDSPIFRDELFGYIKKISQAGVFKKIDSDWLINLLFYMNTPVSSLIVNREDIQGIDIDTINGKDMMKWIKKFPYNQIPIYDKNQYNIIAVLGKKDIAMKHRSSTLTKEDILKYSHKPLLLPKSKNILDVLRDIYHSNLNIALVTDEHGGVIGIITANDIVTKIFERVNHEENGGLNIKLVNANLFFVKADVSLSDINRFFNVNLFSHNFESIGGYLLEKMKMIPKRGEVFEDNFFVYTIKNSTNKKIISIEMIKKNDD